MNEIEKFICTLEEILERELFPWEKKVITLYLEARSKGHELKIYMPRHNARNFVTRLIEEAYEIAEAKEK
jgi:hypothetical protein